MDMCVSVGVYVCGGCSFRDLFTQWLFLQEDLDETGPTAPQDLWLSKTLDGSIWYLQSPPDEPPVEVDESAPQTRYAVSQIYISKGEMVRESCMHINLSIEYYSVP